MKNCMETQYGVLISTSKIWRLNKKYNIYSLPLLYKNL